MTPRLWTGQLGKALRGDPHSQALASYLITCPHGNMLGLFNLPLTYVAADLGWSLRTVRKALDRLAGLDFVEYDEAGERVLVVEAWRVELCKPDMQPGDNRRMEVAKLLRQHLLSPLTARFLHRYPATREALTGLVEGLPEPLASPSEGAPEGVACDARVTSNSIREQQQQQQQGVDCVGPSARTKPAELAWRVSRTWEDHLKARRRYYEAKNGKAAPTEPTLEPRIAAAIQDGIKLHDAALLAPELREQWERESKVRAAGIGIFYSKWHTGEDKDNDRRNGGTEYLQAWRPWIPAKKDKPSPVDGFAELYFKAKGRARG